MKKGCAWIIGIIALIYAVNHPPLLWLGGALAVLFVIFAFFTSAADSKRAKATLAAKAAADAAFLNSIPDVVMPALSPDPPKDLDVKAVPKVKQSMPTMSQNVFKYGENTKALTDHVDYLDGCQSKLSSHVQKANSAYGTAISTLERQQADLYRLAYRAAQNVATIEVRFPSFAGRLEEIATGWVPPKPPVPSVYGPQDHEKAMRWLGQMPSVQIGRSIGSGDWRAALVMGVITAAVKVIQFQKISREVSAAHGTVVLSAKKVVDQHKQLSAAYERVAHISGEVHRRSEVLFELVSWFAAQERQGAFAGDTLDADQRRRLIEMASYAHLARARAGQTA